MRALIFTIAAILFSAVVGAVTTVVHQSHATIATVDLPWGLVLSLIIVASWLIGLLLLGITRWGLVLSGLALMGAIYVLSQRGPGGSVLVPDSLVGSAWIIGVPLLTVVIIFWPRKAKLAQTESPSRSLS